MTKITSKLDKAFTILIIFFIYSCDHILQKHTKETLVSKTTVAKLVLPLKDISWNMKSLDFSWNKAKPLKVETALGLKVGVDC